MCIRDRDHTQEGTPQPLSIHRSMIYVRFRGSLNDSVVDVIYLICLWTHRSTLIYHPMIVWAWAHTNYRGFMINRWSRQPRLRHLERAWRWGPLDPVMMWSHNTNKVGDWVFGPSPPTYIVGTQLTPRTWRHVSKWWTHHILIEVTNLITSDVGRGNSIQRPLTHVIR